MSQGRAQGPRGRYRDDEGWVTVDYGSHSLPISRSEYEARDYEPSFDSLPFQSAWEAERNSQESNGASSGPQVS